MPPPLRLPPEAASPGPAKGHVVHSAFYSYEGTNAWLDLSHMLNWVARELGKCDFQLFRETTTNRVGMGAK